MNHKTVLIVCLVALALVASVMITGNASAQGPGGGRRAPAAPAGTGFTYQGQLKNSGALVNGTCTLAFRLYDDPSAGNQIGSPITQTIPITGGLFTTQLNTGNEFGATAFNGEARWLEIRVSNVCPSAGSFTALTPREPITPAPYALTAMKTAYKNVLVVAKQGGHYNTITAALTSITDNSATNRYLIWIAPGTYTETVTMKQYVDMEGAGELATKITQVGNALGTTGTLLGANNAELRFLTVENTGGSDFSTAIYNGSASPHLTHVTAIASGGVTSNRGVFNTSSSSPSMTNLTTTGLGGTYSYGVINASSSPTMTNVVATGLGATESLGVYNFSSSSPTMTDVTATGSGGSTANYGVFNDASSPTMTNVTATASGGDSTYGVRNTSSSSPTMMNVTATGSGGTSINNGVDNFSSSPQMTSVTAKGSGGTVGNVGVSNGFSSPTMMNVTASASGGINSYGVYNGASSPTIQMSALTASGGTSNYGIYNTAGSGTFTVTVNNSVLTASGGTSNYGIYNTASSGTFTMTVNNSVLTGSTNTVRNDAEFTTLIGTTKLDGGAVNANGGTVTCAGVYDESFVFSASSCP